MKLIPRPPTKREILLLALATLMVVSLGAHQLGGSIYLEKRRALARTAYALERKLVELSNLQGRSEEIRELHAAVTRAEKGGNEARRINGDLLRRLEEVAENRVHLIKVYPDNETREDGKAKYSLEFVDDEYRLDDFLMALVRELGGEVHAFQASLSGSRGELRCQATVLFTNVAPAPGAGPSREESG